MDTMVNTDLSFQECSGQLAGILTEIKDSLKTMGEFISIDSHNTTQFQGASEVKMHELENKQ